MNTLKSSIIQDLENSGYLDKVRAEIRATLIRAAQNHDSRAEIARPSTLPALESELGQICGTLVKDFMESFRMDNSLAMFVPEAHMNSSQTDVEELERMFQTKSEPGKPLLLSIVKFIMDNAERDDESYGSNDSIRESQGTASLRGDASVTSLAIEEYDHIEPVRKTPKY